MTDRELAQRIVEERRRMARKRRGMPYYMLNLEHPAVAVMYAKWRAGQGPHGCPPSDEARTEFEISMMSQAGRALLEEHFEVIEKMRSAGPGVASAGPCTARAVQGSEQCGCPEGQAQPGGPVCEANARHEAGQWPGVASAGPCTARAVQGSEQCGCPEGQAQPGGPVCEANARHEAGQWPGSMEVLLGGKPQEKPEARQ